MADGPGGQPAQKNVQAFTESRIQVQRYKVARAI